MPVTISQPYGELCLANLAAASAHFTFCSKNERRCVSALTTPPPRTRGGWKPAEGVRSAWAAGTAWTFTIPTWPLSPGVWTHPAHRLGTHIRLGLLEGDIT